MRLAGSERRFYFSGFAFLREMGRLARVADGRGKERVDGRDESDRSERQMNVFQHKYSV